MNDNITVSLTYLENNKYKTNHLPIVNDVEEEFWAEGEKSHLLRKNLLSIAFNGRKWRLRLLCVSCIIDYSYVTIEVFIYENADEYIDDHKKETSTQLRSGEVLSLKKNK